MKDTNNENAPILGLKIGPSFAPTSLFSFSLDNGVFLVCLLRLRRDRYVVAFRIVLIVDRAVSPIALGVRSFADAAPKPRRVVLLIAGEITRK